MLFVNGVVRWVFFLQMRDALAVIIYCLPRYCGGWQVAGASPPPPGCPALKLNLRGCFGATLALFSPNLKETELVSDRHGLMREPLGGGGGGEPWRRESASCSLVSCQHLRTRVSTLMAPKNSKLLLQPCFGDSFMLLPVSSQG